MKKVYLKQKLYHQSRNIRGGSGMKGRDTGLVFVYGTLKINGYYADQFNSYRLNCLPGTVNGTMYTPHGGWPCVVLDKGGIVHGELHKYKDYSAVLQAMNMIEGYQEGREKGNLFNRVKTEITLLNGSKVKAFIYVWGSENIEGLIKVKDGFWEIEKPKEKEA
jgi:gamma-glutamylcyclotransferase (GGCT)/AIG2-like uncharacterized protein YtfP